MQLVEVERVEPRLLSLPSAATYSALGIWTLRRLIYNGTLTPHTFEGGRRLLVEKRELDALIDRARGQRAAAPRKGEK